MTAGTFAGLSLDIPRIVGIINVTPDSFSDGDRFADLFTTFGFRPQPLMDKSDLLVQGNAQYILNKQTPSNLILLDTPDFDTGLKGTYLNRGEDNPLGIFIDRAELEKGGVTEGEEVWLRLTWYSMSDSASYRIMYREYIPIVF